MLTFLTQLELLPTRIVSPDCSMGGLATTSCTLCPELLKRDQPLVTFPWMWTLPVAVPRIETLPEPLLSSRWTGPETVRVRSKLSSARSAAGAAAAIPKTKVTSRANLVSEWRVGIGVVSAPRRGTDPPDKQYASDKDYVPAAFARLSLREPWR